MKTPEWKREMSGLIELMAECHETEITQSRLAMIMQDLEGYSVDEVNNAWKIYRSVPTNLRMPTAAQLKQHIPDGRPTVNEAWAMIPHDEDGSVVWSEEMRAAYAVARPLVLEGNISGAFFAFKEAYERELNVARVARTKPKWSPSFGHDQSGREAALFTAVEKKRIQIDAACSYLPEIEYNPTWNRLLIENGRKVLQIDNKQQQKVQQLVSGFLNKNTGSDV